MIVKKIKPRDAPDYNVHHRPALLLAAGTFACKFACTLIELAKEFQTDEILAGAIIEERDVKGIEKYRQRLGKVNTKSKKYRIVTCLQKNRGSMQFVKDLRYALRTFYEWASLVDDDVRHAIAISAAYRAVCLVNVLSCGGHGMVSLHQLVRSLQQSYKFRYRVAVLCKPAPDDVEATKIYRFMVWLLQKYAPFDAVIHYEKPKTDSEIMAVDAKAELGLIGLFHDKKVQGATSIYEILESFRKSDSRFYAVDSQLVPNPYVERRILIVRYGRRDHNITVNTIRDTLLNVASDSSGHAVVVGNCGPNEFTQAVDEFRRQTSNSSIEIHYAPVLIREDGLDKILVSEYEPAMVEDTFEESDVAEFESLLQEYLKLVKLEETEFVNLLKRA